jgi:CBS domain-containing protein
MAQAVREVMTSNPVALSASTPLVEAARAMRDRDVGAVVVLQSDGASACGVVTDRDVAIRAVAEGRDPRATTLDEICSHEVVTVGPDDSIDTAVDLMRQHAIRRLVVVGEGNRPQGILSLGDLAVEREPDSALGEISAAEPNR